jgi:hypothetical protein
MDYQVATGGLNMDPRFPYISLAVGSGAAAVRTGLKSPKWEQGLDQLRLAETPAEATAAIALLQQAANEEFPWVIYGAPTKSILYNPKVKGLYFSVDNTPLFDDAYIAK